VAKKRMPDLRKIRPTATYSASEIACLFTVHRNTVFRWVKDGLQPLDDAKPLLFYGAELKRYLKQRSQKRKRPCTSDEMPCFRCRAPRKTRAGSVVIARQNAQTLTLSAICITCGTRMYRAGSAKKLHLYQEFFGSITIPPTHLPGQGNTIVNGDETKEK